MATKNNLYHTPSSTDVTDLAAHFRFLLAQEFPGQTFKVRVERFSMGSAVDVEWEDGPTEKEVSTLLYPFQGIGFDGMTDSKTYHKTYITPDGRGYTNNVPGSREASFHSYIHFHRLFSTTAMRRSYAEAALKLGWQLTMNQRTERDPGKYGDKVRIYWDVYKDGRKLIILDDAGHEHHGEYWHIAGSAFWNEVTHWRSTTSLYERNVVVHPEDMHMGHDSVSGGKWDASIIKDRDWTWITFPTKPPREVLDLIKNRGGRWSKRKHAWYITKPDPDLSFLQAA